MNADQRNRVANAAHRIAEVILELRTDHGEISGRDIRYLEQGHFQLTKALGQKQT